MRYVPERTTYVLPYDVDRLIREEPVPPEYQLDKKTWQAATTYCEAAMSWAILHLDDVCEPMSEIPYEDCEYVAAQMMRAPAIFWNLTPHPMTLDSYTAWVVTGYVAAGIRAGNRELQARSRDYHQQMYRTVQAVARDPRSYAEIEQARRAA